MTISVSGFSRLVKWNRHAMINVIHQFMKESNQSGLHVSFACSSMMTSMNARYRGKTKNTDILSFPNDNSLGTIYINPNVVFRKTRKDEQKCIRHFRCLLIHGLVHLLGYDHETDQEWREMVRIETYWWRRLPPGRIVAFRRG